MNSLNIPFHIPNIQVIGSPEKSLLETKLEERITLGCKELLDHADAYFNLQGDPKYNLIIPESVKWQLLHAASTSLNGNKVKLNEEFYFYHLNANELALLYRILNSYVCFYETGNVSLIKPYLSKIEIYLQVKCLDNPIDSMDLIQALRNQEDINPDSIIRKLTVILEIRDILTTFSDDPGLTALFDAAEGRSHLTLKQYITSIGQEQTRIMLEKLRENYKNFISWQKKLSVRQVEEGLDPTALKMILAHKKRQMDRIFGRYDNFFKEIVFAFEEKFDNKLLLTRFEDGRISNVPIDSEGVEIVVESFRKKGKETIEVITCYSYEDYSMKLSKVAKREQANCCFVVRGRENHDRGIHQTPVYFNKNEKDNFLFISDSGTFDVGQCGHKIVNATQKVMENPNIISHLCVRQRDWYNCGFFTGEDIKLFSEFGSSLKATIEANSKSIVHYFPCIEAESKYANLKTVRVIKDLPLVFMKGTQSLSQLEAAIENRTPEENPFASVLERVKNDYLAWDLEQNKAVYLYTLVKAIQYRLKIILEVMSN